MRAHDRAGRLTSIVATRTNAIGESEPLYHYTYTHDLFGNITGIEGRNEQLAALTNAQMQYDSTNRLIRYNGQEIPAMRTMQKMHEPQLRHHKREKYTSQIRASH